MTKNVAELDAYEDKQRICSRNWNQKIPRRGLNR